VQSYVLSINASIGVAVHEDGEDITQLIRDADLAMLDAKKHGRGRHVMFDPGVARHSRYHLDDVRELRSALDRSEVEVFFQPQVDLVDGGICSVEALARWRHPERGLLGPGSFIGLAEASGLIVRLGALVLQAACMQAGQWLRLKRKAIPVAVNISPRQLDDEDLPAKVRRALEVADLPAELLSLEITETAVMSDPDRAERVLRELHEAGIHLAIDDFGTGYSSLVHLKRLPVDEIKIDRTFVDGVDQKGDDQSIVAAVVNMASALDLRIVGEGVETAAQAEALVALGCRVAQGYLYGPPMEAARISHQIDHM
jgi:EAL domain-containing protein (putative c-di-GMP-specific phosphodiesterase class I)